MQRVTLDEARECLLDLVDAAVAGEEVLIAKDAERAVQLVPRDTTPGRRRFGSARGLIEMAPDFDEPLEDFREYMA